MNKLEGLLAGRTAALAGELTPAESSLQGGLSQQAMARDYNDLSNKPKIESTELKGNKSLDDIGVLKMTNADLAGLLV